MGGESGQAAATKKKALDPVTIEDHHRVRRRKVGEAGRRREGGRQSKKEVKSLKSFHFNLRRLLYSQIQQKAGLVEGKK